MKFSYLKRLDLAQIATFKLAKSSANTISTDGINIKKRPVKGVF